MNTLETCVFASPREYGYVFRFGYLNSVLVIMSSLMEDYMDQGACHEYLV